MEVRFINQLNGVFYIRHLADFFLFFERVTNVHHTKIINLVLPSWKTVKKL